MRWNFRAFPDRRDDGPWQYVAFAIAALLSCTLFIVRWNSEVNWDGVVYLQSAREFALGRYAEGVAGYGKFPLYSLLISLLQPAISDWVVTGRAISLFCMLMAVFPLYRLTRDMFGHSPAFWAILTFALLPNTLLYSVMVIRDPPFFLLFLWGLYFAQKTLTSRRVAHLLTAVSFVVASGLFRAEGLFFLVLFLITLAVTAVLRPKERGTYLRLVWSWMALAAIAIILLLISMGFSEGFYSRAVAWAGSFDEYFKIDFLANYKRIAAELQRIDDATRHSIVGQHFAGTAKRFMPVIFLLGVLQMVIQAILPINLVPLIWGIKRSSWDLRHTLVIGTVVVFLGVLYVFFVLYDFILIRYFYLPAVLLCPWVGAGVNMFLRRASTMRFGGLWVTAVVAALIAVPALGFDKHFKNKDDLAVQAGVWIAGQGGFRGIRAVFSDPVVAFHADRVIRFDGEGDTVWYPDIDDQTFARVERFASERNAGIVVLYLRSERRARLHPFQRYTLLREFTQDGRHVLVFSGPGPHGSVGLPSPGS